MSATTVADVQDQVQKFWSPLFMDELRASMLIGSLVNKDYEGQIKQGGDTVKVSQIVAAVGQNRTVGVDADAFATEQLQTLQVEIKADKRSVAGFEFDDLSQIQSQIGQQDSKIRAALVYGVGKQINDYLYSLVAPSASAPDHILTSISAFDKAHLLAVRLLASQAKWGKAAKKYILADPSYYNDLLGDTGLNGADNASNDEVMVAGQIGKTRIGFTIFEDDGLAVDQAVSFHPDFLHLVHQTSVQFKISDQHVNNKFSYKITADIIYGAKLGIAGNKKHILSNAGSATSVVMA
jgi:hypothetical protein